MSALTLVIVMLIAISSGIAAVLITVAVSSLVQARRDRLEPSLGDVRQAIVTALSGDESEAQDTLTRLGRLSKRYVVSVMLDVAPSVTGTSRSVLVSLAEQIGVIRRALRGVRSRRWSTRLYSARVLTAFGVESEDLATLVTDRSPDVRAQAAAWCAATPTPSAIEHLIGLLNDPDGRCRFAAQDALIRIGLPGSQALVDALETSAGEVTMRILKVASAMGDERFYGRASALTTSPSPDIRALAIAALARTGDAKAGPTLVALLEDESSSVALAAAAGLAKLAFWPGAADVEPLLSHPAWDLRKQAGLTLLALGAPGSVLLRATALGDGPAAEMAIQTLQLQSLSIEAAAA
jgi:HEAT repeat protein